LLQFRKAKANKIITKNKKKTILLGILLIYVSVIPTLFYNY